ncbi:MAG: 50S ribosomal protein L21 [Eubacteriales bacterium]
MYAIFQTGGKQYKAEPDGFVYVEKIEAKAGEKVEFDTLLFCDGKKVSVGTPIVKDVKIKAEVVKQGKGQKVIVFKHKAKKDYKKKQGHRQPFTQLKILSIGKEKAEVKEEK